MKTSANMVHDFRRQQGVVLFIALIVLVAMTLAAIALIRSVDTVNQIAGNLAFKQGATHSGDFAVETARTWLVAQTAGALWSSSPANGYYASTPTVGQGAETSWDQYDWTGSAVALPADAAGNQVSYVIHRLCKITGDPSGAGNSCLSTVITGATPPGSGKGAGKIGPSGTAQFYYRITNRVIGPRNTVSYMQTLIQI